MENIEVQTEFARRLRKADLAIALKFVSDHALQERLVKERLARAIREAYRHGASADDISRALDA